METMATLKKFTVKPDKGGGTVLEIVLHAPTDLRLLNMLGQNVALDMTVAFDPMQLAIPFEAKAE